MSRRLALILTLLCAACKPTPQEPGKPAPVRTIRATVVTVRTTLQPGNKTITNTIVIVGDRARNTAEHDTWRLFDVKAKTVTFVDDIERTIRTEPVATVAQRRRELMAGELPAHFSSARITPGDLTRTMLDVTARQTIIESGSYRRELWLAEHPSIPRGLFAMMQATETPSSPLAPMMRNVDDALSEAEGFPLLDHAEVAFGEKKFIVDRVVVSVEQKDVAEATIVIPAEYRDLNAK